MRSAKSSAPFSAVAWPAEFFTITEELAISASGARPVIDLLESGDVEHIGMSLDFQDDGVFVDGVDPGSIAEGAGLMPATRW